MDKSPPAVDQTLLPENLDANEKVSSNTNTTMDNAGLQTGPIPEEPQKAGTPSTEAETLLRALQNVIIPLIRSADGVDKRAANKNELGLDGEEFIIALQKFMLSFLRSRRSPVGGVEVELEEKGIETSNTVSPTIEEVHNKNSPKENEITGMRSGNMEDIFERGRQHYLDNALKALREHVFDVMPIRLLNFKPHGSKLKITLIERGAVYMDIAQNLKATIYDLHKFPPQNFPYVDHKMNDAIAIPKLILQCSKYAILSHTWLRGASGEVTYGHWNGGEFDPHQPGYQKLLNFCRTAWKDHGVAYGWMDTVCINKESSAELDESIRSMHKWYSNSHVCITYLADTIMLSDMPKDNWFKRGWTLQELIAPSHIKFYNSHWKKLADSLETDKKNSTILEYIKEATTITASELRWPIKWLPISRRMQMAATRQVTREEDSVYSLMGIFNVSIATAYGEGAARAFSRLLQEILNSSQEGVVDIFNWAGSADTRISTLLPSTLQDYLHRAANQELNTKRKPIEPLLLTHLGLRISIMLMPALSISKFRSPYDPIGGYHGIAVISIPNTHIFFDRSNGTHSVLDARLISCETDVQNKGKIQPRIALGVLNIGVELSDSMIMVPKSCLAVGLWGSTTRVPTEAPIVFTLKKRRSPNGSEPAEYDGWNKNSDFHYIERSDLERHGMKLVTMHL